MKNYLIFAVLGAMLASWGWGIWGTPTDIHMGEVYRIIYLHVPCAMTAFFSSFLLFITSILALWRKDDVFQQYGKAIAEVGIIFTLLTLFTGSIWGYPTWGTYWTWDARLTTTLILAILYAGYLLLYASMSRGPQRAKVCAVLGIIIFADVPIIYKSVTWWRTLHQPPTLMRPGGSSMSGDMKSALVTNIIVMLLIALILIWERVRNLQLEQKLEELSYRAMR